MSQTTDTAALAQAGAAFGPWGAAAGAVLGTVGNLLGSRKGPARAGDIAFGGITFDGGPRKLGPLDFAALGLGIALGLFLASKLIARK